MDSIFEGRVSASPYIETIWRGRVGSNYAPICPASGRWDILFLRQNEKVRVSVEGPLTKATPKTHAEGTEWLVIRFELGTFLPHLPVRNIVDTDAILPLAGKSSFWLHGTTLQFPDYENVETFVDKLVCDELLLRDPIVSAVLAGQSQDMSSRTVRRRFRLSTGLTPKALGQIERALQAVSLLEQGISLLDTVNQAGYADQSHMTRSLKRFIGQTPAQIARASKPQ